MLPSLTEQEQFRIEKLKEIRALGIEPYPSASFVQNTTIEEVTDKFSENSAVVQQVQLAGRIMSRRIMGSASFCDIQDHTGTIQLYIQRDTLCRGEDKTFYNKFFKKLLDISDIIGIKGETFTTKVGTLAIKVEELTLLTKAVKPLPVVKEVTTAEGKQSFYTFSNPEQRYRQRYVDLILNPEVRDIFIKRAKLTNTIRRFFDEKGYLEVETPILQPIYGGAAARPFVTHHNTLDIPLYLRISNELYLKRLIVGGYPGVYEFSKDFRNEGMSRFHNPEFTQVEVYVAYQDYYWMMDKTEELIRQIALDLYGKTSVQVGENLIDFGTPWKRFTMFEVIEHYTGIDIAGMEEGELRKVAKQLGVEVGKEAGVGKIIDEIFGAKCEPKLIQPTFIMDYPIEMSPLAKQHRDNPLLVERFEVICNGKEIANSFSELNDPIEQAKRFRAQQALSQRGDDEAMPLDTDFLRALKYGMPPTVGIGIGIDRLTMIMTNSNSIQEVLFFPQMKPNE